MSTIPKRHECTAEQWAEIKAKARADLEFRLSHGLPHSDKPLPEKKAQTPAAPAKSGSAQSRKRAARKAAPTAPSTEA